MSRFLVRFAPSPTGNLHVGNMRTALVNYLFARATGGDFMLRIDDTDDERSTPAFEASIRADLQWMQMDWDREDRQSTRIDRYNEALEQLLASGGRINALKHRKSSASNERHNWLLADRLSMTVLRWRSVLMRLRQGKPRAKNRITASSLMI